MTRPLAQLMILTVPLGVALSGCGGSDSDASATNGAAARTDTDAASAAQAANERSTKATGSARGKTLKVVNSRFGRVVADAKGEALYLFTKERSSKSRCYGACAVAWPPLLTKGKPRAGKGINAGKLGTTKRRDGKLQVTYNGHPLYYYKDDSPGKILCQAVPEFGGIWYVVSPSGKAIT